MTERLTTLAAVKDWLYTAGQSTAPTPADAQLVRLIDAVSIFILSWLNRDTFGAADYVQNFRGNGKDTMLLKNWPVTAVSSVGIGGTLITPSVIGAGGMPGSGYVIGDARQGPQSLDLYGNSFWYRAPCQIKYTAGLQTTYTSVIVLTSGVVAPFSPNNVGQWVGPISVTINGVAGILDTTATTPPTPSAGHYYIDTWGYYTFSAADVGKTSVITYSYCPWDVAQAATETIAEWYKKKDRIGILSKTLGGQETITFTNQDLSDSVRGILQGYMNVVPL